LGISPWTTLVYPNKTVIFEHDHGGAEFYDKSRERLDKHDKKGAEAARGILRQEITLRKKALDKLTGKKWPTLRDITIDCLIDALEGNLQQLGIFERSIGTKKTTLNKLCFLTCKMIPL
jgi:hypothetical protein